MALAEDGRDPVSVKMPVTSAYKQISDPQPNYMVVFGKSRILSRAFRGGTNHDCFHGGFGGTDTFKRRAPKIKCPTEGAAMHTKTPKNAPYSKEIGIFAPTKADVQKAY